MNEQIAEILRLIHNLINIGIVSEVRGDKCRVHVGGDPDRATDWISWLAMRAGTAKTWWPPSPGEQAVLLAIGGEPTTAVCFGGVYSDDNPAPCDLPNALHISFPDSAVLQYNPDDSSFLLTGAKTAHVSVAEKTTWDCPDTEFLGKVTAETLSITKGGEMKGDIEHTGGKFSSNGVVVDDHRHGGVKSGGDESGGPVK